MADDGGAAKWRPLVSNCTIRAHTLSSALWASAFQVPVNDAPLKAKARGKASGAEASRFTVPVERAPPMAGTPCVRLKGTRVCLGHTGILLPGTYKRTSYQ